MKRILLSNKYVNEPFEIIKTVTPEGFELIMLDEVCQEDLVEKAFQADYILASGRLRISRQVLDRAEKLKMIQRTGVGLDSLDLEEITARKIPLYVNRGVNAKSVAEHAVLLMLACVRKLMIMNENTKSGIWKKQSQGVQTRELGSQTVGIIGMGNIGMQTAAILNAFGAKILYYSRHRMDAENEQKLHSTYVELDELFQKSDIISLHCPLAKETEGLICKESLERMKDGAILINTARGKLIKETDLIEALQRGKISFAALDVYEQEPTDNHTLLTMENVIATPHIGGITYDSFYAMMQDAMRNIAFFEEGKFQEIEKYRFN